MDFIDLDMTGAAEWDGLYDAEPTGLAPAAPAPAVARLSIGGAHAELRRFDRPGSTQLAPGVGGVHLIAPSAGEVTAITERGTVRARPGDALLLCLAERSQCFWSAGSAGLVVHLRRDRMQAEASRVLNTPRRLASVCAVLPCPAGSRLALAVTDLMAHLCSGPAPRDTSGAALEHAVCSALIDAIQSAQAAADMLPVAGSVNRVMQHLRRQPNGTHTADELAAIAGVTVPVLRRNFTSCLGIPLAAFARDVRLDWVRERLCSQTESRSIETLAAEAGFGGGVLTRAYQRRFQETPSRTRARVFSAARA